MRKIEKQMVEAIKAKKPFNAGNTCVTYHSDKDISWACVSLHGNPIAMVTNDGKLIVNLKTLRQWPTVTTKSRLRALGANVKTKAGVTYLNGKAI